MQTFPAPTPVRDVRRWRAGRRVLIALLVAFVAAGAIGLFGVRTDTTSASDGPLSVEVTYGQVTRPGLATPWAVTVTSAGGFDGPITVATTAAYFDLFDENGLDPEPESATTEGDAIVWTFEPPEGEVLALSFDGRIEPARQNGARARTVVEVGERRVELTYRTIVLP